MRQVTPMTRDQRTRALWTGRKPTIRTLEMLQFYFTGWATQDELMAHLDQLKTQTK